MRWEATVELMTLLLDLPHLRFPKCFYHVLEQKYDIREELDQTAPIFINRPLPGVKF